MIAFQYKGPDSSAGEVFDQLFVESYLPRTPVDIDEYRRLREAVTYTDLVHLSDALQRLRSSSQYSILTSLAWVQPLLSRNEAVDVPLGADAERMATDPSNSRTPATRISGSVTIYGGHLLFADLDLKAALPSRAQSETGARQSSGDSFIGRTRLAPQRRFEVFRISEMRRIKLGNAHYFDHPYIGAILLVTRYE